ncbi:hypothetical protein JL720_13529 [Aureococcus anophagefferens]|nr:hypothetical protein JL720_13529 [Aureococcus anophagefferens]
MALAFRYRKNACDALPAVGEAPACAVADGPAAESALYARACFVPAEERADLPDFRGGQPNAAVDGALAGKFPEGEHEERTLRALHDVAAATGDSLAACYEGAARRRRDVAARYYGSHKSSRHYAEAKASRLQRRRERDSSPERDESSSDEEEDEDDEDDEEEEDDEARRRTTGGSCGRRGVPRRARRRRPRAAGARARAGDGAPRATTYRSPEDRVYRSRSEVARFSASAAPPPRAGPGRGRPRGRAAAPPRAVAPAAPRAAPAEAPPRRARPSTRAPSPAPSRAPRREAPRAGGDGPGAAPRKKRDRYGRKPVLVRRAPAGGRPGSDWQRFASCKDALRATPGLTSYVLSALVNKRVSPATSGADFEAKFVAEDDDDDPGDGGGAPAAPPPGDLRERGVAANSGVEAAPGEGRGGPPAGYAVLLPGAPGRRAARGAGARGAGDLLALGGRCAYVARAGETLATVAAKLAGARAPRRRKRRGSARRAEWRGVLEDTGSALADLLWLAQLEWSDAGLPGPVLGDGEAATARGPSTRRLRSFWERVKRRVVAPDGAVEWRPATVAARGDATLDLVDVAGGGVVTAAYPTRRSRSSAASASSRARRVAGRVMEVVAAGRVARAAWTASACAATRGPATTSRSRC